jgi:hypothetical protein
MCTASAPIRKVTVRLRLLDGITGLC